MVFTNTGGSALLRAAQLSLTWPPDNTLQGTTGETLTNKRPLLCQIFLATPPAAGGTSQPKETGTQEGHAHRLR